MTGTDRTTAPADRTNGDAADGRPAWARTTLPPYVPPPERTVPEEIADLQSPHTDVANAARLQRLRGEDLRYVGPWGKWLTWTGTHWPIDDLGMVQEFAKSAAASIYAEAAGMEEDTEVDGYGRPRGPRTDRLKWAARSEGRDKIEAMQALARSAPGIAIHHDVLDHGPQLLNVPNGTIDLRTGLLLPHVREHLITRVGTVPYDPDARAPRFERFMQDILPDDATRNWMQRALGYSCTGNVEEQVLFLMYGTGANGKSTLINVINAVLGPYARPLAPDLLVSKTGDGGHPTEKAHLFGLRYVSTIETESGKKFAEALLKQLTGGDPITARRMHENFWTFFPTHKIWIAANHKPETTGTDHGFWRRMRLVPFRQRFAVDRTFQATLMEELPGVLAWLVRGAVAWQARGLEPSKEVREATAEYRGEQDTLARFLIECCERGATHSIRSADLYAAFVTWARAGGEERIPSQKAFSLDLAGRGLNGIHKDRQAGGQVWTGLRLQVGADGPPPPSGYADD